MDNIEAMPTAVNYALLEKALTAFEAVKNFLTTAQVALSPENQFRDTKETAATLDCSTYYPNLKNNELTLSYWNCLTLAFFSYCLTHIIIVR
ncbi:MAG: hypothetical protein RM368_31460 [Nostoc sp. DedSLP03]|uniref:hypothetical protein n=1 Tax=Nostoc sp. DedSLP03 TaxID=3075400 RepID=UPI002AD56138|nr:hypothetical protein [Nostoc sp. DedSLP03]MDZ7969413.1 hypothetical protein [Nostoc sp. DedSLP03]